MPRFHVDRVPSLPHACPQVDRIVQAKRVGHKWWYLIRWKGWGAEDDTWEPSEHITCADDNLLAELRAAQVPAAKRRPCRDLPMHRHAMRVAAALAAPKGVQTRFTPVPFGHHRSPAPSTQVYHHQPHGLRSPWRLVVWSVCRLR